ncbi:terminase small subunit [Oceanobacillus sojae]|uniref:Terminase n=1 Tax=Oceanobacillus sojae TaxID=582851 RepID=A0A511ZIG4_9BACI|nr:terminase small subunit [Oceanobacillus sojae]GEN87238.1 terminase [Oceanobacillus sojae]
MAKLTEKQKRFADYYIESGNATESAKRAGYKGKNLNRVASENLTKLDIKQYIDEQLEKLADTRIMKAQEALELLTSIARGELKEELYIPTDAGVKHVWKIPDIKDRQRAVDSLLKRYPMNKHDELQDALLQAQINKLEAETEKLKKDDGDGTPISIQIVDSWTEKNE